MLHGQDEHKDHLEILRTADDALSTAEQAILEARAKLAIAVRNYQQRMIIPELRPENGQRVDHRRL